MKTASANPSPTRAASLAPERFYALIPCAGQGSRALADSSPAASQVAKQYRTIAGKSLVFHTLASFAKVARLAGTLVVVAPGDGFFDAGPRTFDVCRLGGASRADSVLNGLAELQRAGAEAQDWVLVHDAARCLVTPAQINSLIDACAGDAVGGLLAHRLPDTLKAAADGRVCATLDRADKWLAQTPQMFRLGPLQAALQAAGSAVTDESSAMEAMGLRPMLVAGSAENFKVTYPEDFALAEAILLARSRNSEAGNASLVPGSFFPANPERNH
jgi:2-C-methyl-D-erythritol 4-phosphate cytidylyltransferase